MNEVMAKKPRQIVSELGSITFFKANLEQVQHRHADPLVIQLQIISYNVKGSW